MAKALSRRRKSSFKAHVDLQWLYRPIPDKPHEDHDHNSYLHPDRHYRFMKAFLYLRDVPIELAPYTYVRGSHRFNWSRIKYEYKIGRRWPRLRWARRQGVVNREQKVLQKSIANLADELISHQKLETVPIVGKRNTLILSDNPGFHRRNPLLSNGPRVTAIIDFKFLESTAHHLYPILRKWD